MPPSPDDNPLQQDQELWTNLPTRLDPKAGQMLLDFVLRQKLPDRKEGTLTAFNLAGYAAAQFGFGKAPSFGAEPEPSQEEKVAAAQALADLSKEDMGPQGKARGLPWAVILKIAFEILRRML